MIPITSVTDADGAELQIGTVGKWLRRVTSYPARLVDADASAALVLDGFAWDLHLGDVAHATDTHDGHDFLAAATTEGKVSVYVVAGADPRRGGPDALDEAAGSGDLFGADVGAYAVDVLDL